MRKQISGEQFEQVEGERREQSALRWVDSITALEDLMQVGDNLSLEKIYHFACKG